MMSKNLFAGILGLGALAAIAVGAWWVIQESGWIALTNTAPHPRNLAAAITRHLVTTPLPPVRCASLGIMQHAAMSGRNTFEDTQFDYNPPAFRVVISPNVINPVASTLPKLQYLARHGFLESKTLPDGATEFTMTWKGFAASSDSGCFDVLDGKPAATVIESTKKRRNGVVTYQVVARVSMGERKPWTNDKDFAQAFGTQFASSIEPQVRNYELARDERGFAVIAEKGTAVHATNRVDLAVVAFNARSAGRLDSDRIKAMLQSHLDGIAAQQAELCLPVPTSSEVDETDFNTHAVGSGAGSARNSAYFTFYNLVDASPESRKPIIKGYLTMRKLEELGLAKSEEIRSTEFKDRPAAGGVRFTLVGDAIGDAMRGPRRCILIGKLAVDEILAFEQIEDWRTGVRYWSKLKVVPVGAFGEKALSAYGHYRRVLEVGLGFRQNIQISGDGLRFSGSSIKMVAYEPDVSKASLPVVIGEKVASVEASRSVERPIKVILRQVMNMSRISSDGLTMTYGGAGAFSVAISSVARSRGRWYAEATLKIRPGASAPDTYTNVGVARKPRTESDFLTLSVPAAEALQRRGPRQPVRDGEVIGIAFDADASRVYFLRAGNWTHGPPGNPNAGMSIAKSLEYVIIARSSASSGTEMGRDAWTLNFGASRFYYPIPPGYRSYDARLSGSGVENAAPPSVPSRSSRPGNAQPPGVAGAMNRCRNSAGRIEYRDKPCAESGMEQLGVVGGITSSRRRQAESESGGDRIIWIDPGTGAVRDIPLGSGERMKR